MELYSIETGNFMLDGGALFGVVPKSIWEKRYPADEKNLCNICMRCLLIIEGERKILIDCGMGDSLDESLLPYYFCNGSDSLLSSLQKIGVSPEEITDVVLSHLHFDHAGGIITKHPESGYSLTFPNAQYIISSQQWESALKPNRRERPSFLKSYIEPLAQSNAILFITENTELIPGVELRLFHGHTAGQIVPYISYKSKKLVYCADLIPTAAHIPISFVCGYDLHPLITMKETELFLEDAFSQHATLMFEHDLYVECCTLKKTEKGISADTIISLKEFTETP